MSNWCGYHQTDHPACPNRREKVTALAYGLNGPVYPSLGKSYSIQPFLTALNKNVLPWDDYTFKIKQANEWGWDAGTGITISNGAYTLYRDTVEIATLTNSVEGGDKETFNGFIPLDEMTWRELKFILEVTGWEMPD